MALVVEDGTGLPDAESYLSVDGLRDYAAGRGLALGEADDARLEQALRQAADYIDGHSFRGMRELPEQQALEFPRVRLFERGVEVAGLPRRVVQAAAEAAVRALKGPLRPDLDRGGRIASESVGPISVSYAPDAPAGTVFAAVDALLAPYLLAAAPAAAAAPRWTPPRRAAAFGVGLHDAGYRNPMLAGEEDAP